MKRRGSRESQGAGEVIDPPAGIGLLHEGDGRFALSLSSLVRDLIVEDEIARRLLSLDHQVNQPRPAGVPLLPFGSGHLPCPEVIGDEAGRVSDLRDEGVFCLILGRPAMVQALAVDAVLVQYSIASLGVPPRRFPLLVSQTWFLFLGSRFLPCPADASALFKSGPA